MTKTKKSKGKISLFVYKSADSINYIADVLGYTLGYDHTQALNCANIIALGAMKGPRGVGYVVKTFPTKQSTQALSLVQALATQGLKADLV